MKHNKLITAAIALVLASIIALSGIGCIVTAFDIEVDDWTHIVCLTVFFAAAGILCLSFQLGELVLTLVALVILALQLHYGQLLLSLEKLINHITLCYDAGYHWGFIRWSEESLLTVDPDTALTALAALIALSVSWVVYRRQWFGFAVIGGLLPLIACCIVTDTIPDNTCLWLLLTGLLLVTLTQRMRRISVSDANRLTALLLIPTVLLSSLIFRYSSEDTHLDKAQALQKKLVNAAVWLMDRGVLPQGSIAIPVGHAVAGTVDLTDVGALTLGDGTALRVTATDLDGVLYLRGQAYDYYSGLRWEATVNSDGEHGWPSGIMGRAGQIKIQTDTALSLRYFPYYIQTPDWMDRIRDGYYPNSEDLTEYGYNLCIPGDRTTVSRLQNDEREQYLDLPDETLWAAEAILEQAGIDTRMDPDHIAEAVTAYVRASASYDTNTRKMPALESDFAIWFLEDSETGYCVHFASAAAVLMRAAGVPARYVTGYMTRVSAGAECAVLENQAHAWVEYYHRDHGWTVLEATPVSVQDPVILTPAPTEPLPTTEPTLPTETTQPTLPTLPTETAQPTETTQPIETVTTPTGPSVVTRPTGTVPTTTPTATESVAPTAPTEPQQSLGEQLNLKWIRGILWVLAVWLLLAFQYRLRIRLRKKRMRKGTPNQQALCRWHHVRRLARVSSLTAQDILPLAEKAAFSQHSLTEEELAAFDDWFRRANEALLEKPWLIQFLLRLIFAVE